MALRWLIGPLRTRIRIAVDKKTAGPPAKTPIKKPIRPPDPKGGGRG